jgi:putative FmdB family regulatory protein
MILFTWIVRWPGSEFGVRVSAKLILEFDTSAVTLHVMPIYEFHCEKCERDSEILVRSSDWKGTKCPSCGSTKLKKKLSVFASGGADAASAGPACSTNGGGGSCGCHCAGGKHRH